MSEPEKSRHRMKVSELRSRVAEIGYFSLAFVVEVLAKAIALSLIANIMLPTINLEAPRLWTWVIAVTVWELYDFSKRGLQTALIRHAKEEHRHHSPAEPNPMEGFVPVQVIMAPSPITVPTPTVPDAPPKDE